MRVKINYVDFRVEKKVENVSSRHISMINDVAVYVFAYTNKTSRMPTYLYISCYTLVCTWENVWWVFLHFLRPMFYRYLSYTYHTHWPSRLLVVVGGAFLIKSTESFRKAADLDVRATCYRFVRVLFDLETRNVCRCLHFVIIICRNLFIVYWHSLNNSTRC